MPNQVAREDVSIDVRALFRAIVAGKFMILLWAVIGLITGIYLAYFAATPRYTATSLVMMNDRQEQVIDYESVIGGLSTDREAVNNELEVLRSRSLIEKVVERQSLEDDPEFNPRLQTPSLRQFYFGEAKNFIKGLLGRETNKPSTISEAELVRQLTTDALLSVMTVRNIPQSLVFEISVESSSPRKAKDLANSIAQVYLDNQLALKHEVSEQATIWLRNRVEELQTSLLTAENDLKKFRTSIDLISSEALTSQEVRLKETRDRIADLEAKLATNVDQQVAMAAAQTPMEKAAASGDVQLQGLLNRIDTPSIRASFDSRFESLQTRTNSEVQLQQAQIEGLKAARDELLTVIERQGRDLLELQQREREVEATRSIYEYFLNRLMQTSAQEGLQQADSRLLSQAKFPFLASSPQKTRILVLMTMLGALIGAAVAVVRELNTNTYRESSEIEETTPYMVIGQVPNIRRRRRQQVLEYFLENPASAPAEAVRNLRTSVLLSNIEAPPKVIMVTSSLPGEGKTTISCALAMNLGMMGKKVLLIEGDIRRRAFKEYFPEESKNGKLVKAIEERMQLNQAVFHSEKLHADVLFSGETQQNAADLFATAAFKGLIASAREEYDHVIIDTAPTLLVSDSRVVGHAVDAAVFVVAWNRTTRQQVRSALSELKSVETPISGIVLNNIDTRVHAYYGYGYASKYYTN